MNTSDFYNPPSDHELFQQILARPQFGGGAAPAEAPPAPVAAAPNPPQAENRFPGLPYTDPETHKTGTVPMDQARDISDQQDAIKAKAAEMAAKEEKVRQINLSPVSAEERQRQIHEVIGPGPQAQSPVDATPIDLETTEGVGKLAIDQNQVFTQNNAQIADKSGHVVQAEGNLMEQDLKNKAPIDQAKADFLKGQYEGLQQLEKDQAAKTQEAIGNYHQTNEDMRKMAVEKPQDLFGQAGMNGILGRISMFLGGAGTNGNHENRNLAFIQDMANRNIQKQERNWNHLKAVGENDKSVYGMIRDQTKDAEATTAIMNNMYLSSYEANLKAMADKYPHQRAQVAVGKALVAIDQQRNANDQIGTQALIGTGTKLLQVSGAQAAANARITLHDQKEREAKIQNGIPGYHGYVPKELLPKIAQFQSGGISIADGMKRIQQVLASPKGGPYEKERLINVIRGEIKGAARKYYETGTRLEGPEIGQMETVATSMIETVLAELRGGGKNFTALNEKINGARQEIMHSLAVRITSETKALSLDKADKVWDGIDPDALPDVDNPANGSISTWSQQALDVIEANNQRRAIDRPNDGAGHMGEH